MMPSSCCFVLSLLFSLGEPSRAAASERLVFLPIQNLSGVGSASAGLRPALEDRLAQSGYSIVGEEAMEPLLEAENVRYLDSVTAATRDRLLRDLGAGALLYVTVQTYAEGSNSIIALSGRLVGPDGRVLWSDVASLTAADTEGAFGRGRAGSLSEVADRTLDAFMARFPHPGGAARLRGVPARRLGLPGPRAAAGAALAPGQRPRVCLLPLENFSAQRGVPRKLAEVLWVRLAESGRFEPVEPAELRAALRAEKLQTLRNTDPAALKALGERVGADLFLYGTVYQAREASHQSSQGSPELELQLTLVDVRQEKVVWSSDLERLGTDYQGLLQFGSVSNLTRLADRMIGEILDAAARATPGTSPHRAARTPTAGTSEAPVAVTKGISP